MSEHIEEVIPNRIFDFEFPEVNNMKGQVDIEIEEM